MTAQQRTLETVPHSAAEAASEVPQAEAEDCSEPGEALARLLEHGAETLSDVEILVLLLRREEASALEAARRLLRVFGGLAGLLRASPLELRWQGLEDSEVGALQAALDLAARLARVRIEKRPILDQPSMIAGYLLLRYLEAGQEIMGALFVDVRHRLLGERVLFRGTTTRAAVEPSVLLREALLLGARGIVLFHNHPSADPSPSSADLRFTHRLYAAAETIGLRLVDHLILGGPGAWVSLNRRGLLAGVE